MEVQSLVTIVPWTFIAQICNLFIQMWLIKHFLFQPINKVLAARREAAQAQLTQAKEAKDEAERMKAEYEQNLAQAKAEAGRLLQTAQKTAQSRSDAIIAEADAKAAAIRSRAEAELLQERRRAVSDIKTEIGSMAVDIAEKVIEREVSETDHKKLIDEFIENVGEAS